MESFTSSWPPFVREINRSPAKSSLVMIRFHDDVIQWKHFPRHWPFVRGIHRSPVNSLDRRQWRRALMFSLIYSWMNGWINIDEGGDWRRHRVHYDATVMPGPPLWGKSIDHRRNPLIRGWQWLDLTCLVSVWENLIKNVLLAVNSDYMMLVWCHWIPGTRNSCAIHVVAKWAVGYQSISRRVTNLDRMRILSIICIYLNIFIS